MGSVAPSTVVGKLVRFGFLTALTIAAAVPVANAVGGRSGGEVRPQVVLGCDVDACVVEGTYVLPARHDGHVVRVRWQTVPAGRHGENRGDVLERELVTGVGSWDRGTAGWKYRVKDLVWHSDIRCDRAVHVEISIEGEGSGTTSGWKPVPVEPSRAHCTDYGMPGESD